MREGKEKILNIEVGSLPESPQIATSNKQNELGNLGLVVRELSFEERRELKISHGVLVTEISPEGIGAQAGIGVGDIITYIGNQKIRTNRELENSLERAKEFSDTVMIGIFRDGVQTFRSVKLTK